MYRAPTGGKAGGMTVRRRGNGRARALLTFESPIGRSALPGAPSSGLAAGERHSGEWRSRLEMMNAQVASNSLPFYPELANAISACTWITTPPRPSSWLCLRRGCPIPPVSSATHHRSIRLGSGRGRRWKRRGQVAALRDNGTVTNSLVCMMATSWGGWASR